MKAHIHGVKCPCCETRMKMSISEDDYFVMVWFCSECGHYMDQATESEMLDYRPVKQLKYTMGWLQ